MRSPARPSADSEAIEAELICKRAYAGDLVDRATAMVPIRPPIPRTIVRHRAHAQIGVQLLPWPPHKTTAGRAMQHQNREPLWITPDRERERPTIRRLERPWRLAHQSRIAVRLGAVRPLEPEVVHPSSASGTGGWDRTAAAEHIGQNLRGGARGPRAVFRRSPKHRTAEPRVSPQQGGSSGPAWTRTRDQPIMSRLL